MGGGWQHLQWGERSKGPARYCAKGYFAKLNNLNLKQLMMANIDSWHLPSLDFFKSSLSIGYFDII